MLATFMQTESPNHTRSATSCFAKINPATRTHPTHIPNPIHRKEMLQARTRMKSTASHISQSIREERLGIDDLASQEGHASCGGTTSVRVCLISVRMWHAQRAVSQTAADVAVVLQLFLLSMKKQHPGTSVVRISPKPSC